MHFGKDYRHWSRGAWPFSTPAQSYTVSNCTAERPKAVLYLQEHLKCVLQTFHTHLARNSDELSSFTPKLILNQRTHDAVDVMLSLQNSDGGFTSYELIHGPQWPELPNPAEVWCVNPSGVPKAVAGRIVIEHNYPECTTSVLAALTIFRKHHPEYRAADIE